MRKRLTVDDLHQKAMLALDRQFLIIHHKTGGSISECLAKALYYESKAAMLTKDMLDDKIKLTRSILFRSAASIALQAGRLGKAKNLAMLGLSLNPHPEIKEELEEVLGEIEKRKGKR